MLKVLEICVCRGPRVLLNLVVVVRRQLTDEIAWAHLFPVQNRLVENVPLFLNVVKYLGTNYTNQ